MHYHLLRKEPLELASRNPNEVIIRVNEPDAVSRTKRRLELCALTACATIKGRMSEVVVKMCIVTCA